jgi:catechol 2,3-dioxygenase-like lactoylglutathione lyase family enzyme
LIFPIILEENNVQFPSIEIRPKFPIAEEHTVKPVFCLAAFAASMCLGMSPLEGQTSRAAGSISETISLQRMDHVGINVTNLQRSADWYQRILGFTIFHKWQTTWMISRDDMRIGLFLRPDAKKVDDLDNRLAVSHFAYATDDKGFQEAQDRLKKLGVKFDSPEDTGVAHSIFIYDPDGHQVEITSYYK